MSFCEYKDIFGKPREGIHATRIPILDVALWDVVGAIVLIFGLIWLGLSPACSVAVVVVGTIILHRLFCVNTRVNEAIFGKV